jgi:predicted TIM-barrel fold metal-dependent hydrolase
MDDRRWRDGYALLAGLGLHFELQAPWWHLDAAAELARDFPGTAIVLNHAGLPADRGEEGLALWRRAVERLAAEPNVVAKISGIGVPSVPWPRAGNARIVRDAIAIFGASRCMFASNFPVDGLVGGFGEIFAGFEAATRGMDPAARRALFRDNALRVYRIDPAALHAPG